MGSMLKVLGSVHCPHHTSWDTCQTWSFQPECRDGAAVLTVPEVLTVPDCQVPEEQNLTYTQTLAFLAIRGKYSSRLNFKFQNFHILYFSLTQHSMF